MLMLDSDCWSPNWSKPSSTSLSYHQQIYASNTFRHPHNQFDVTLFNLDQFPPTTMETVQLQIFQYYTFSLLDFSSWTVQGGEDSMILKISWAVDLCRSRNVWFQSGMVLCCQINYQKFGEFMFGEIITKKLVFTFNFSVV